MEYNSVGNPTSDNKIGLPLRGRPICLSPVPIEVPMSTDRIGRHEVLLPINQKNYSFREKRNSLPMKEGKNLH